MLRFRGQEDRFFLYDGSLASSPQALCLNHSRQMLWRIELSRGLAALACRKICNKATSILFDHAKL